MSENQEPAIQSSLHSTEGVGVVRLSAKYDADIGRVWSAITEPHHLHRWFGKVSGDLHTEGEFAAVVHASGWDGRGHIDTCDPPRHLAVTLWEEEGVEHAANVTLAPDGAHTTLNLEVRGVPIDVIWAYGAGWQEHLEDLALHLHGHDRVTIADSADGRFDELASHFREMPVEPL